MNYQEISDFEINRAVACRLDGNDLDVFGRPMFASDCYFSVPSGNSVEWHQFGCDESKLFDPCNNPSDAWPIILQNGISIEFDAAEDGSAAWWNSCDISDLFRTQYHKNPLRAAMIVFLMMQEGDQ